MAEPFSIDNANPVVEPTPISIDPGTNVPAVDPKIASDRSFKAYTGMPNLGMSYNDIYSQIIKGDEEAFRSTAATKLDLNQEADRQLAITRIVNKKGSPLNDSELQYLDTQLARRRNDPKSVIEEQYANRYIAALHKSGANPDSFWQEADADTREAALYKGKDILAKNEFMNTLIEDAEQHSKDQSIPGDIVDRTKELLPFYWQFKQPGEGFGLRGERTSEYSKQLYHLPFEDFKKKILGDYNTIVKDNPYLAASWLKEVLGQSTSDKSLDNLFSLLDLPILGTAGKITAKAVRAIRGAREERMVTEAVKSMVKATTKDAGSEAAIEESAGSVREAAIKQTISQTVGEMHGTGNPVADSLKGLYSAWTGEIDKIKANPGRLRQELVNRITERAEATRDNIINAVQTSMKVERLPAVMAVDKEVRRITEALKDDYPGLKNNIMDIKLRYDEGLNVHYADFYLGKNGREGIDIWGSQKAAETFANKYFTGGIVEPKGTGFHIRVAHPLRETEDNIRSALLATKDTRTPDSWFNAWGGWLRTPEETLSLEQRMARKVAAYGMGNLQQIAKDTAKEIKDIKGWRILSADKRKKWNEWQRVVEATKGMRDPDTGRMGRLLRDPVELDHVYSQTVSRLPDEQEVAAYFAQKRLEEIRSAGAEYQRMKNLLRLGTEQHEMLVPSGTTKSGSTTFKTVTFNGVKLKEYPTSIDSLLHVTDDGTEVLNSHNFRSTKFGKTVAEDIKNGTKSVFEIVNPEDRPLAALGQGRIRYVVADKVKSKPLEWGKLTGRAADYDYDHYVVQGIVQHDLFTKFHWYEGDRTLAGFNIGAMAKDVAEKIDKVRQFLHAKDEAGAKAYLKANSVGIEFEDIKSWFTPKKTVLRGAKGRFESKIEEARLSLEHRIQVVPRNKMSIEMDPKYYRDMHGSSLRDGAHEGYGRYFGGQKYDPHDIFTLRNEGTKANPLYAQEPVKHLDPITSINRSLAKVINSTVLDDYKVMSVEHWIQEAGPYLRATREQLASSPFYHFHNPTWRSLSSEEQKIVRNLTTANFQIRQFLGIANSNTTFLHSLGQRLADASYERGNRFPLVSSWLLPKLRDPFSYVRSLTFDATLGLFTPGQFLVQLQTYSTIMGIAGFKYAAPGTKAALFHSWARFNKSPEILDHLDKLATNRLIPGTSRWKPGEWKEAHDWFIRSGMERVAGEHALLDNPGRYDLISDGKNSFLNLGRVFFREGERSSRTGAWYTAFKEFKDLNPTLTITNKEARQILERADILYGNMSRASSSALHQGIWSVPTQFLSYQLRIAELVMGKRLTDVERMRLFGTYAALYGMPVAFGITGFPLGDYIRKWSFENGYVVGERWWDTALTEGLPSAFISLMTGQTYNVGERFAPQGIELIRDALMSNKTWTEVFGGASYQKLSNSMASLYGYYAMIQSGIRGDGKFKPKVEDLVGPLKEISSVNSLWKTIAAINTGRWLSKNESILATDVSPVSAIMMGLTGLSPQEQSDMFIKGWTREQEKDLQTYSQNKFTVEWRRGLQEMKNGNPTQATEYFNRAFTWLTLGGFPEEKYSEAIVNASKDYESMISRANWDYYTKDVSKFRKGAAQDALVRLLKQQGK